MSATTKKTTVKINAKGQVVGADFSALKLAEIAEPLLSKMTIMDCLYLAKSASASKEQVQRHVIAEYNKQYAAKKTEDEKKAFTFQYFLCAAFPCWPRLEGTNGKSVLVNWPTMTNRKNIGTLTPEQREAYNLVNSAKSWKSQIENNDARRRELEQVDKDLKAAVEAAVKAMPKKDQTNKELVEQAKSDAVKKYKSTHAKKRSPRLPIFAKDGITPNTDTIKKNADTILTQLKAATGINYVAAQKLEGVNPQILLESAIKQASAASKNPTEFIALLKKAEKLLLPAVKEQGQKLEAKAANA